MNIRKFIKTNRLFLAALCILIVIIAILLSLRAPSVSYKISPDKLAAMLADSGNQVSPILLYEQLSKNLSGPMLVDIRSTDEFSRGHIDKAVNIPVRDLLKNRSLSFFKDLQKTHTVAILYGEDQLQASGPWMLLKQVGITNVKVLQGGYAFYKTLPLADSLMNQNNAMWLVEIPNIDTAAFRKNALQVKVENATEKVQKEKIVPVKKEISTGGGC